MQKLTVRVDEDQYKALADQASMNHVSISQVVRELIDQGMARHNHNRWFDYRNDRIRVSGKVLQEATKLIRQGLALRAVNLLRREVDDIKAIAPATHIVNVLKRQIETNGEPVTKNTAHLRTLDLTVVCHRCGALIHAGEKRWVVYGDDGYNEHYHVYQCSP